MTSAFRQGLMDGLEKLAYSTPVTSIVGALAGAGAGALIDKKKRLRGALIGALLGTAGGAAKDIVSNREERSKHKAQKAELEREKEELVNRLESANKANSYLQFSMNDANNVFFGMRNKKVELPSLSTTERKRLTDELVEKLSPEDVEKLEPYINIINNFDGKFAVPLKSEKVVRDRGKLDFGSFPF